MWNGDFSGQLTTITKIGLLIKGLEDFFKASKSLLTDPLLQLPDYIWQWFLDGNYLFAIILFTLIILFWGIEG